MPKPSNPAQETNEPGDDTSDPLDNMQKTCEGLADIGVGETHELAATLWNLSIDYFKDVRMQAQRSFNSALVAASVGTGFFFLALGSMMFGWVPFSRLTLIAGMTIQVISGINFYLYAKTSHQFFAFHVCLERANRFLLADTMCDNLGEGKDKMRAELIRTMANAPILSFDYVQHGGQISETEQSEPPKK